MSNFDPASPPLPGTDEFLDFIQTWDVIIIWDKDHTMVDQHNIMRPHLEDVIVDLAAKYPDWKQVILTENNMASVKDMFSRYPRIEPVFDMLLTEDNYFSRKVIYRHLRQKGVCWWPWSKKIYRESIRRKRRRVHDLFLGKKVVLIDDLRGGRIPEHSYCVSCRIWTGEAEHEDELNWPMQLEPNILRILENIYRNKSLPRLRQDHNPSPPGNRNDRSSKWRPA
ncbi:MAG: hypothetical protein HQL31_08615 [Planctomycetes bacterium]|nr:hypothetical protein [Planctomycetota bacterium]